MSKRKPKPATVGKKIAGDVYPEGTIDHAICRQRLARRIYVAIRRAVKAERQRCADIVRNVNRPEALAEIESGGIP